MAPVSPVTKEKAPPEVHETFGALAKKWGKVPNLYAMMAHRPNVLKNFLPFYNAILNEGSVDARYKELAFLKTAMINGCEY